MVNKEMETVIKMNVDQFIKDRENRSDAKFLSELREGYLWAEVDRQEQFIEELTQELETMNDKDSFKAQYLESWIGSLKIDLEKDKKLLK